MAEVLDKIKNKPNDRRIIMTAWNPAGASARIEPGCQLAVSWRSMCTAVFDQWQTASLGTPPLPYTHDTRTLLPEGDAVTPASRL